MRSKKEIIVVLQPKTEAGKIKLGYHGDKWVHRGELNKLKYSSAPGPFLVLRSKDGSKIIFVRKTDDPDYNHYII